MVHFKTSISSPNSCCILNLASNSATQGHHIAIALAPCPCCFELIPNTDLNCWRGAPTPTDGLNSKASAHRTRWSQSCWGRTSPANSRRKRRHNFEWWRWGRSPFTTSCINLLWCVRCSWSSERRLGMSGAPEGMTLCNGVACGLRGRRQLIVVGLLHVRVQRQGGGHCEVDSRAAWWWTVVRAKGEEEAKEGYSGGVVGMTLCSKFWRRNGKKKFIMYHGWLPIHTSPHLCP